MALETIQSGLYLTAVFVAFITAVIGIITLNVLFRNKLKDLFTDHNFFIFFFMIFGYLLSALGELLWFLIFTVFGEVAPAGMQDVYSVAASLCILLSFVLLTFTTFKTYGETKRRIVPLLIGGAVLVITVLVYNSASGIFQEAQTSGHLFLAFFYPITTSLIVTFSASVLFFWKRMAVFGQSLLLLFLANVAFLLADILYIYTTLHGLGVADTLASVGYIAAYGLSSLAFIVLLLKVQRP